MTGNVRVVPAILTDSPEELVKMVSQANGFTDYVQFDIMDGEFVPSRSITSEDLAEIAPKFSWEAHLMMVSPEIYIEGFKNAGARKVIFHYEATNKPGECISRAREFQVRIGIALNPETNISSVLPLVSEVDSVLFLSVHPGFYGSEFMPEVLDKIEEFRKRVPAMEIGIDGGVKETNMREVVQSGVNSIYVGSAIFKSPDPMRSFFRLDDLAREMRLEAG